MQWWAHRLRGELTRPTLCSLNFPIPRKLFFNTRSIRSPLVLRTDQAEFLSGVGGHHSAGLSLIAVAWWAAKAMGQIYLRRLKDSLDTFFAKVEAITSELIEGVACGTGQRNCQGTARDSPRNHPN